MNETEPEAIYTYKSVLRYDLDSQRLLTQDLVSLWGHSSIHGKGMFLQGDGCVKDENFPIDPSDLPNYSDYTTYKGISVDPLGQNNTEKYHLREKKEYNTDGTLYSQEHVYFRVRDLAPVYEYTFRQNIGTEYNTYWSEYIDGGLVEY